MEGTEVTVGVISEVLTDSTTVVDSFMTVFESFVATLVGEPLIMVPLTLGLVAGISGLAFKVIRRLGFKAHR